MGPLVDTLHDRMVATIRARGPLPFAAFMSMALYDARDGYYATELPRTGWSGHFVTSPELHPSYGELWARALDDAWDACERPRPFDAVEIGPGEGRFARAVLDGASGPLREALRYRLVERMPRARARQEEVLADHPDVTWSASITEVPRVEAGCVVANEVLDNLPVHLVEKRDGELLEVCVTVDEDRLTYILLPPPSPEPAAFFDRLGIDVPEGHRAEVPLAAESFVLRCARALERGNIFLVDYGARATDLVARPQGTLVCYSATGPDTDPLHEPGRKDITTHVNWTSVTNALARSGSTVVGPVPQRAVLASLGSAELDDAARRTHDEALASGRGAEAIRALSRRHALAALTDPAGLGGLDVVAGVIGCDVPAFLRT